LLQSGECFLGGEILLLERYAPDRQPLALTPAESRFVFAHKDWQRVVGIQTGGRVDGRDEVRWDDLEARYPDGVYLCSAMGSFGDDDAPLPAVLQHFETTLASSDYPQDKVLVGNVLSYPRMAGAREAVFDALCSKNRGCSHAVVTVGAEPQSRESTERSVRSLFESLDDIGVTPVFGG
jgi:ATP sulfurylase